MYLVRHMEDSWYYTVSAALAIPMLECMVDDFVDSLPFLFTNLRTQFFAKMSINIRTNIAPKMSPVRANPIFSAFFFKKPKKPMMEYQRTLKPKTNTTFSDLTPKNI